MFDHEKAYRKEFDKRSKIKIIVCGVGALGSNLIENLCKQGFSNIKAIDFDRVERHNVPTQVWSLRDVGGKKADLIKNIMFREVGVKIEAVSKKVTGSNARSLFKGADLVVDTFDNGESRGYVQSACRDLNLPLVHAGMSEDGFAEVKWDGLYKIREEVMGDNDPCDYPLARNIILLTITILSEVIAQFVERGLRRSFEVTLNDLRIFECLGDII